MVRMSLRHAAHAVYDCQYHLVWTPKRRRPVLAGAVGERLNVLLIEIGLAYDIEISEWHVAEDHVHIFCQFPPRHSISKVVTCLKSHSARALFREFPVLRQRMWGGELWEDGYFVRTVGDSLKAEVIRRYIQSHRDASIVEPGDSQLDLF
jgi:putative transposase